MAAGFFKDKIPQAPHIFNSPVDDKAGLVDGVDHQLLQLFKFIKIMPRFSSGIPIGIVEIAAGRYAKHPICRHLPARADML